MQGDFIPLEMLIQSVKDRFGSPVEIKQLGGKSGAYVYRVRFADTSLIAKISIDNTEYRFYKHIAPLLRDNDIPLPHLEASMVVAPTVILLLEDIPYPLPRDRWQGDARLIDVLARLHRLPLDSLADSFNGFKPTWTSATTDKVLDCFPTVVAAQLQPVLRELQAKAQPLFSPHALISGDPNPLNWGLRADGTHVLFDWERFTRATPAIDLAIIIGSLGDKTQFRQVAETYLSFRTDYPLSAEALTEQIALAKVWTIVDYLHLYAKGILASDALLDTLTEQFPAWLQALELGK